MKRTPTISVLMPVFNCAPYLDAAINSIRAQTCTDLEFVIVNDGSTDGSLETLQRHAREDSRISVLSKDNQGIVSALNAALDACRGEFVARMDGDDVSAPRRLELQLDFLRHNPSIGLVGTQANGMREHLSTTFHVRHMPLAHSEIDRGLLSASCDVVHASFMARRDLLLRAGGYRECCRTAEDLDLLLRCAEISQLANLPETLYTIRFHSASISVRSRYEQAKAAERAIVDAYARRKLELPCAIRAGLERRLSWTAGDSSAWYDALRHALRFLRLKPYSFDAYWLLIRLVTPAAARSRQDALL